MMREINHKSGAVQWGLGAKRGWFATLVLLLGVVTFGMAASPIQTEGGTAYFVDCEGGADSNSGTSSAAPWKSLDKINETTFAPGDSILLKRGTSCRGVLWPKGSGQRGRPIVLGAYGAGALPLVVNPLVDSPMRAAGATEDEAVNPTLRLFNQQYWHIRNLELVGGNPYGLFISGDTGILRHFRVTDLVVRGVTGRPATKRSGLVAILGGSPEQSFEDVVLDGVTAYETSQWAGIVVDGGHPPLPRGADGKTPATLKATDVMVRNCVVYDVAGDGIVLFRVRNGLLDGNVAWATGMMAAQDPQGPANPNAIWVWRCENCVMQYNEGFLAESEGVDGGVYDIDWGSHGSVIQHNYGHDSQGYCMSVFGAGGGTTTASVVRYNVCIDNGRSPRLARRQGDLYLSTWGGGSLDGVQIYNNTFYWNPPLDAPFLRNDALFVGERPNFFQNNLVVSTVPLLTHSNPSLEMDHNLYWYIGSGQPKWFHGDQAHAGFEDYRQATGQDTNGIFADPRFGKPSDPGMLPLQPGSDSPAVGRGAVIPEPGAADFFGRPLEPGREVDIGAVQSSGGSEEAGKAQAPVFQIRDVQGASFDSRQWEGSWVMLCLVRGEDLEGDSVQEWKPIVVSLRSLMQQYQNRGLQAALVISGEASAERIANLVHDWDLKSVTVLSGEATAVEAELGVADTPVTVLLSPGGEVWRRWLGRSNPARLGVTLRWILGPPLDRSAPPQ
jgi:hypothetical protein